MRWRGRSIGVVGALHAAFAVLVASGVVLTPELLAEVGGSAPLSRITPGFGSRQPFDLAALSFFWSIAFGWVVVALGLAIDELEARAIPIPRAVGAMALALGLVGAACVPIGGFLLIVPAAVAILARR